MEWHTTESGEYRIESLSAATLPGALKVLKEAFCQHEAFCIGVEMANNPAAVEEMLELGCFVALEGLSLVAVEIRTEEVAAVVFNILQVPTPPNEKPLLQKYAEEKCKQPPTKAFLNFVSELDERVDVLKKHGVDCSLDVIYLATHSKHRRNHLGTLLIKYSLQLAKQLKDKPAPKLTLKDLGPRYSHIQPRSDEVKNYPKICQTMWTAIGSRKIGSILGFEVHLTVPMNELEYNGKSIAKSLDEAGIVSPVVEYVSIVL